MYCHYCCILSSLSLVLWWSLFLNLSLLVCHCCHSRFVLVFCVSRFCSPHCCYSFCHYFFCCCCCYYLLLLFFGCLWTESVNKRSMNRATQVEASFFELQQDIWFQSLALLALLNARLLTEISKQQSIDCFCFFSSVVLLLLVVVIINIVIIVIVIIVIVIIVIVIIVVVIIVIVIIVIVILDVV